MGLGAWGTGLLGRVNDDRSVRHLSTGGRSAMGELPPPRGGGWDEMRGGGRDIYCLGNRFGAWMMDDGWMGRESARWMGCLTGLDWAGLDWAGERRVF